MPSLKPVPRRLTHHHFSAYACEGVGLGIFMFSAGLFAALLEYPGSALHHAIASPDLRRLLMGIAMGLTAIGIIYSPLGRKSGAHINPAVTLAFLRLKRIGHHDALYYIFAQFLGGAVGVGVFRLLIPNIEGNPNVQYVVTVPGPQGLAVAILAEFLISFLLMLVVLASANTKRFAHFTGVLAGLLVAIYITLEAPLSGMSMNPARSFGSALVANNWTALWIYFVAPPLGMLLATEVYTLINEYTACAKLHHDPRHHCIFCVYRKQREQS